MEGPSLVEVEDSRGHPIHVGRGLEKVAGTVVGGEERLDTPLQRRILSAPLSHERRPPVRIDLEGCLEDPLDPDPAFRVAVTLGTGPHTLRRANGAEKVSRPVAACSTR